MPLSVAEEIGQQLMTGIGEHALRVELHPLHMGVLAVPEPHDRAVLEPGRDFEAVGQRLPFGDQGVIAGRRERLRQPGKDPFSFMQNR